LFKSYCTIRVRGFKENFKNKINEPLRALRELRKRGKRDDC